MLKREVLRRGIGRWRVAAAVLVVVGWLAAASGASASAPAFTQVSGSPFSTAPGIGPVSVAFGPGGLLATADQGNAVSSPGMVSVFSVGPGGALAQVSGSPFATGAREAASVAFSPGGGLLAVTDLFSLTTRDPARVSVFSVGPGGALTAVSGSPFATGGPPGVAFSPSGGLLATANGPPDDTVSVFSVGPGGALTPVTGSPFPTVFGLAGAPGV